MSLLSYKRMANQFSKCEKEVTIKVLFVLDAANPFALVEVVVKDVVVKDAVKNAKNVMLHVCIGYGVYHANNASMRV